MSAVEATSVSAIVPTAARDIRQASVSVIVPTAARAGRRALIWRAINSILDQDGVSAVPTVIVNGPARDPGLTQELMADPRIRVHVLEKAGLPNALQVGRRLVETPFFAELDDDDVLLPAALSSRVEVLMQNPDHDCVVTNGYKRFQDAETLHIPDMNVVERDPIRSFWDRNWLLPGSYLCRTDRVGADVFDGMPEYLECSFIALRLATTYRIKFLQRPTVSWSAHSPDSLSKSRNYVLSCSRAHEQLLRLHLPSHARRKVQERITWACHSASDFYLHEGDHLRAWRWHMRSLFRRGGLRYLLYTRRLLWPSLSQRNGAAERRH